MVQVKSLEQIIDIVRRAEGLPKELYSNLQSGVRNMLRSGVIYNNAEMAEQRQEYLRTTIADFDTYLRSKSDLTAEVAANLSAKLRPAEESKYLSWLISVLDSVNQTYLLVEGQSWEDGLWIRIEPLFTDKPTESELAAYELEKSLMTDLMEKVRQCFYEFNAECVEIVNVVQQFPYVQQNPAQFPTIVPPTTDTEIPDNTTKQSELPTVRNEPITALTSTAQGPEPIRQGETQTITWNLNASVLYDIFGQLLTMQLPNGITPISREGHTIKHLAAMIHRNIHFAKGNSPTLDQIERQLQRMTEPSGTGAKRDKITIDCRSQSDS